MAWRIDESVIRGEIDNREKGIVRGRIWLMNRDEPVVLELVGNARPDLAGCFLTFENPVPPVRHPQLDGFFCEQRGSAGEMTASRKVRVFEEAYTMIKDGEKPPEHTANALYLEWFSEKNGRVVIESADYKIEISDPSWRLTPEEEEKGREAAEASWKKFTDQLTKAIEVQRHEHPDELEKWDEFDFEKSLRESDALTDKYLELLDKYGDSPESEQLINKEMGWDKDHREGEVDEEEDESIAGRFDVEEINRICAEAEEEEDPEPDPTTEGVDWIRVKDELGEDIRHPLQHRCFQDSMWLWKKVDELGLKDEEDDELGQLIGEYQITGAKLAGALNSLAYGRDTHEPGFIVACLKRALDHLHKAQAALEKVASKKILPKDVIAKTRTDLFGIREEILRLMNEFRKEV